MKSSLVLRLSHPLLAASVLACGFPFFNSLQLNVYTHSQAHVKLFVICSARYTGSKASIA